MATLREIRRRISGVKSTEKITKAMKMVAAAKLRRAQSALSAARPYSRKIGELMQHLATTSDFVGNRLVVKRDIAKVAVVAVTADRGFCGAFNSNIIKTTIELIRSEYSNLDALGRVNLFTVGKKGSDFFSKRKFNVAGNYSGIFHDLTFAVAENLASAIIRGYLAGDYDRVDIVYNEFKSVMRQRLVIEQFLPIPADELMKEKKHVELNYIYEPDKASIVSALIPKHLEYQLWRILLESNAAAEGARMAAMDNASENAFELIQALSLQYNKARQGAITKELLEVVSGAEALTSSAG
ncbi:MAG: ATP synthase F1 subunit gamma [Bacteroidetes bacterium]|nr:ATP synthase F1 subunit gamma [Bacteroidota bacterium]